MKKLITVLFLLALVNVTIKDVPEEAVDKVKQMAAIAVERYLKIPLVPEKTLVDKYNADLEAFLRTNDMWNPDRIQ